MPKLVLRSQAIQAPSHISVCSRDPSAGCFNLCPIAAQLHEAKKGPTLKYITMNSTLCHVAARCWGLTRGGKA
jgi:hypothetical protein